MSLFLKLCFSDFYNETRDYRELSAAMEAGYEVKVLTSVVSSPDENGKVEMVKGFEVHRFHPVPGVNSKKNKPSNYFMKALKLMKWVSKVKSFKSDVLSCHDLTALVVGYASVLFTKAKSKPKLIYDSHEFELGRNTVVPRKRIHTWLIKCVEGFLMKRADLNMMVNESIADEVKRIHNLKIQPLVVRNMPPYWKLDLSVCAERRTELTLLTKAEGDTFFVIYHGAIIENRGIEIFIQAVAANKNIIGIIMGYALDEAFMDQLKCVTLELKVSDRIIFLPAVPYEKIWEYVGAADVGLIPVQNTCMSYYFSLPNKIFESIQSLTPVITSDFPEMKRIIDKYQIGLTCNQTSVDSINSCIEKLRTDKGMYNEFKRNLNSAKGDLCWEKEKYVLIDALTKLKVLL